MKSDRSTNGRLSSQSSGHAQRIVVLGEILWDVYEHSRRLGGAPLNFAVHARRLGHAVTIISALGGDEPGRRASEMIAALDLDTRLIQTTTRFPTGAARVQTQRGGAVEFAIERPAAYDDVALSESDVELLQPEVPGWFYYGSLFASRSPGHEVLRRLLHALSGWMTFYDLNLRPGSDAPELVKDLLEHARVVKLNEEELHRVHEITALPSETEAFCRKGARRYGWEAVAVTLGSRGCAMLAHDEYVEAHGHPVNVVDTVGAGDAFAAAFMHGISLHWPAGRIASFANRVGAVVASRHGAIPDWTLEEVAER